MEERKERVNEKTVEERIKAVENKLYVILESQATIMNAIGAMICMSEIKERDKKMKDSTIEALLMRRDICMEEVHGDSYKSSMKNVEEVISGITDILDKIFK